MYEKEKVLLDIFTELRENLNGTCGISCPKTILKTAKRLTRGRRLKLCPICNKEFFFIKSIHNDINCPCFRKANPEEIFLRLDEYIEELQTIVNKAFT